MTDIQNCKCDPATWGRWVPAICDHYEPIILPLDRIPAICSTCHHDEKCHEQK